MKWLPLLSLFPAVSLAFQQSASPIRVQRARVVIMNYFPDKFSRAEQCATHYGICNLDELEELSNELEKFEHGDEGHLQGRDDYKDTHKVAQILRAQSELKHMMEDYVNGHHEETFDMSDV
eukprot:CAMPEP_0172312498 /NCGR_PEP_ID=MMETSP1058-20130122/17695_1 /TAXON_ID=83371 /ORGANISM="Detonula confervacea, Strain CCMP 353" /LENGTH=120 /DNA_ID=CAMNT_0013025977 /DNA_START=41 /DNA_END=403 /DNA_ORIENTATION=+